VAVAVPIPIDRGKLALDDPVSKFIPQFKGQKVAVAKAGAKDATDVTLVPAEREVTIKDLLTHTSGLSSSGEGLNPGAGSLVNKIEKRPDDTLADYVPASGQRHSTFSRGRSFDIPRSMRSTPSFGLSRSRPARWPRSFCGRISSIRST
jgi:CubicO group peptidase (beta-lactamase class C family)